MMKTKLGKLAVEAGWIMIALLPMLVFAQIAQPPITPPTTAPNTAGGIFDVLCTVMRWFFAIFIVVAVIFVILAAFKYLTAGGDPEKVKAANHALIYAFIAVVVALIARFVPAITGNFIGSGSITPC